MPLSAWLVCEALQCWAADWTPTQLDAAAGAVQAAIVEAAARGGLLAQVGGWVWSGRVGGGSGGGREASALPLLATRCAALPRTRMLHLTHTTIHPSPPRPPPPHP